MSYWIGYAWWWATVYLPFWTRYAWWWIGRHELTVELYAILIGCLIGAGWMTIIIIRRALHNRRERKIDAEIAEENATVAAKEALEKEAYKVEMARQVEATAAIRETYRAKHREKESREEQEKVIRHAQFLRAQQQIERLEQKVEEPEQDTKIDWKMLIKQHPWLAERSADELAIVFACSARFVRMVRSGERQVSPQWITKIWLAEQGGTGERNVSPQ